MTLMVVGTASVAPAQTINWGNAASLSGINFDSGGSLLDGSYTFTLGVFDAGFDPYTADPTTWFANWTELDTATYNAPVSLFSDTFLVTDNTHAGQQAYIWGYNQTTPVDQTAEWVLITDDDGKDGNDWVIPNHSDQTALTLEWRVSSATSPVFGGLNDTQGPGDFSSDPTPYQLQTHTFPAPVPEPGALAFLAYAGFLTARRRRR